MRKMLFVFLLLFQAEVLAEWKTGNDLHQMLSEPANNYFASGMASGYITAIADERLHSMDWLMTRIRSDTSTTPQQKGQLVEQAFGALKGEWACFPRGVTVGQLTAVVKSWLGNNPQRWNENASKLVRDALRENFPCNSINDLLK